MKKEISLKDAIKVARDEIDYGILTAMEDLQKLGFNCKSYFKVMNKPKNWDDDDLNIEMRDKIYKKLKIYDTLKTASKIVLDEC